MAVTNITDLQTRSDAVSAETSEGANSQMRVGGLLRDSVDTLWANRGIPVVNLSGTTAWGIPALNMDINVFLDNPANWLSYVQGGGGCVIQVIISVPTIIGTLIIDRASEFKQWFLSGVQLADDGMSVDMNKGARTNDSSIIMRSGMGSSGVWRQWKYLLRGDEDIYSDIDTLQTSVTDLQTAIGGITGVNQLTTTPENLNSFLNSSAALATAYSKLTVDYGEVAAGVSGVLMAANSYSTISTRYYIQILTLSVVVSGDGMTLTTVADDVPKMLFRTGSSPQQVGSPVTWSAWQEIGAGGGSGDMLKEVYDTDDDGIVDNAMMLNGKADTEFATEEQGEKADSAIQNIVVNGTPQPVNPINNGVSLFIPTRVSDMNNDTGYQNAAAVGLTVSTHNSSPTAHNDIRTQFGNYVPKTGATMTGALELYGNPTTDQQAATKRYVDSLIAAIKGSGILFKGFISGTEPTQDVREGNLWYQSEPSEGIAPDTNFPWAVKIYTSGAWQTSLASYTPIALDLWYKVATLEGWYYLGNQWERLDFGGSVFDQSQFDTSGGSVKLKPEAIQSIMVPQVINLINHEATVNFEIKPFVEYVFVDDTDLEIDQTVSITDSTNAVKTGTIATIVNRAVINIHIALPANTGYKAYWNGTYWSITDNAEPQVVQQIENSEFSVPSSSVLYEISRAFERVISFEFPATVCRDYLKNAVTLSLAELRNVTKLEYSTDGSLFTEITAYPVNIPAGDVWWRVVYGGNDAVIVLGGSLILNS